MKQNKLGLLFLVAVIALASCKKDNEMVPENTADKDFKISSAISAIATPVVQLPKSTNWMKFIADNTNISQLSIPGTHDAAARIEYFPGTTKCQNLSIADQLNAGVRYLDIRCRHINNGFAIHHGDVYQKLSFTDIINACSSFLKNNPSETILMCVKEEYNATGNTRSFEDTFDSYVQQNPSLWNLDNTLQQLSQLRGKINLIKRFKGSSSKGIQATGWSDNTTFDINYSSAKLRVQDNYTVSSTNTKWTQISSLLNEARNSNTNKLFMNYTSGYKSLLFGISNIPLVSGPVNDKADQFFSANKHGKFGIIAMDFISAGTSKLIYETNF
jgi:1-phosphatidylinositol phosphodiesterase